MQLERAAIMASASLLSSCLLFYDSRWGAEEERQKNAVAALKPAALGAPHAASSPAGSDGDQSGGGERASLARRPSARSVVRLPLRILATRQHTVEVMYWQERARESVAEANRVLTPRLGLEFEVVEFGFWQNDGSTLEEALNALRSEQPSTEGCWTVALVGSLSRVETSFHELGMAEVGGKHLVVRAMNDALEFEAFKRSLTKIETRELDALYRARRRHQAAAVLIHELGHALGAVHSSDPSDLMNRFYSPKATLLGDETVRLIQTHIETSAVAATAVSGGSNRNPAWVPAALPPDASARGASLLPRQGDAPPLAVSGEGVTALPGLSEEQGRVYGAVVRAKQRGDFSGAWELGQGLFREKPEHAAVAEVRCQLAMDLRLPWQDVQRHCAQLRADERLAPPWAR